MRIEQEVEVDMVLRGGVGAQRRGGGTRWNKGEGRINVFARVKI